MKKDVGYLSGDRYRLRDNIVYRTTALDSRAALAVIMIEKWGMVAGIADGEDSAGRQKIDLMSVEDLVKRACDTADRVFEEFEQRDWIIEIPPPTLDAK